MNSKISSFSIEKINKSSIFQLICTLLLLLLFLNFPINATSSPLSSSSTTATSKSSLLPLPWRHLSYNETVEYLHQLRASYPQLVTLLTIGKSVHGRELLVIRISTSNSSVSETASKNEKPEKANSTNTTSSEVDLASALQYYQHNRTTLRPTVRLVGALHGDEALGSHLLLALAQHLLTSYPQNSRISHLLNSTDLELLPLANPDGFEEAAIEGDCSGVRRKVGWNGRENAHRKDLEENFVSPDFEGKISNNQNSMLEPETLALMTWAVSNPSAVLAATLHTGALVVSYPLDGEPSITPDDALFRQLATAYVLNYGNASAFVRGCTPNEDFNEGTVIGSRWKVIKNSMADFVYLNTNALQLNLYLSCCKYPNASVLRQEWQTNRESLLQFIESAHMGIKGLVVDSATRAPIKGAKVTLQGNSRSVTTSEKGEFWRLLHLPDSASSLKITVSAYGYLNSSKTVNIVTPKKAGTHFEPAMLVNFELTPSKVNEQSQIETEAEADFPDFQSPTEFRHHDYLAMEKVLKGLAARFPTITRLYSAGTSVEHRELYVLEISDNPGVHEPLEPEFKYVANMHGNEVVGREMVLLLAKLLLENYGHNPKITALINATRLHLMASMNPDGWERSRLGDCDSLVGRGNAHGVDLNRNFPDQYRTYEENTVQEPETEAVMNWLRAYPFVLSANLHGGSLVANYPFDGNNHSDHSDGYSATPDDGLFRHLAGVYANTHPTMHRGECQEKCSKELNLLNEHFPGGIINGAQWYALYGGMQDWNYLHTDCLEITVEMGCRKYPLAAKLPALWRDHRRPLLRFLDEVHQGVKGLIRDQATNMSLAGVAITINGSSHPVHSVAPYGDYWRLLLPGSYQVTATKAGYQIVTHKVVIPEKKSGSDSASSATWNVIRLDFTLERSSSYSLRSLSQASSSGSLVLSLLSLLVIAIAVLFFIVACCPASQQWLQVGRSGKRKSSLVARLTSALCFCGLLTRSSSAGGSTGNSSASSGLHSTLAANKAALDSFHYTKLAASDAAPLFETDDEDDDEEENLHFDLNSLLKK